jgi:hypothetical protein
LELGLRLGLGLGLGLGFEIGLGFGMPAAPPLGLARSSGRDSLSPRPSFFRCAGFRRGAVAAAGTSGSPPIEVRKMSPPSSAPSSAPPSAPSSAAPSAAPSGESAAISRFAAATTVLPGELTNAAAAAAALALRASACSLATRFGSRGALVASQAGRATASPNGSVAPAASVWVG